MAEKTLRERCYDAAALCTSWPLAALLAGVTKQPGDTPYKRGQRCLRYARRWAEATGAPMPHPDSRIRGRGRPPKNSQTLPDRLPDAVSGQTEQTKPPRSDQAVSQACESAHGGKPALPEKTPIQVEMERRERVAGGWDALGQKRRRG